jgi:hypothetical protein
VDYVDDAGDLDDLDGLFEEKSADRPAPRGFRKQRTRVAAAAAAVLALLVVAGAVAYWRDDPTSGEPLGLDLPAPPISGSSSGSGNSASGSGSVTPTSAIPIDDETTFTDPDDADPDDPGGITTTTTDRPDPPPDGPPDPPDPPADTTDPVLARAVVSPSEVACGEKANASALATDNVGVTGATVTWSGAGGSGSADMSPAGESWSAAIGPFVANGSVEWSITATDAAGNQSSAGGKLSVFNCPTIGR